METLKLLTGNFPSILGIVVAIAAIIFAIGFVKRAAVKIIAIVICLIVIGVITVKSTTGKTELTLQGGENHTHTVTINNDENGKVTSIEYDGENAGDAIGKVKDTLSEDYQKIKNSNAIEEIKGNMKSGAEQGVDFINKVQGRLGEAGIN